MKSVSAFVDPDARYLLPLPANLAILVSIGAPLLADFALSRSATGSEAGRSASAS